MNMQILLLIPLPFVVFWLWMAWDMSGNNNLSRDERFYWLLAFLFLNVFAAIFYYVTEYKKRH